MNRILQTLLLTVAGLVAVSSFVLAADEPAKTEGPKWGVDYKAALAESKKTGKPILIDFTGSDWCGYCVKQHAEVFDKAEWQKWASENVILLTADYPRKNTQSEEVKKQNAELKAKFSPRGFPTMLFVDAEGAELGRWAGYGPGSGVEAWIKKATPFVEKAKGDIKQK